MSDAEVLQMLRIAYHNYGKRYVAENCGFSKSYIEKLEHGFISISISAIQKLAGFYNVSSVSLTRFFRELYDYDISKPADYQKALIRTSTFFLENQLSGK